MLRAEEEVLLDAVVDVIQPLVPEIVDWKAEVDNKLPNNQDGDDSRAKGDGDV